MANTKSAKIAVRKIAARTERNRRHRSELRTSLKKVRSAVAEGDAKGAKEALGPTLSIIDRSVKKGIVHRNAADRHKSRLMAAVRKIQKK